MRRLAGSANNDTPTFDRASAYNPAMRDVLQRIGVVRVVTFVAVGLAVMQGCGASLAAEGSSNVKVDQLYANNCASCHGSDMDNGNAPSMLDAQWLTDGSDRALYNAIYDGIEDLGMPAYRDGLKSAEAWALVVHIREKAYAKSEEQRTPTEPNADGVYATQHHGYRIETVAQDLDRPWAIDFLPDGTPMFTERSGTLHVIQNGQVSDAVSGTPEVWNYGQGGLLDVAVDPDYAENGWIYLSYSEKQRDGGRDGGGMTAVVRGRIDLDQLAWTDQEDLYHADVEHASEAGVHFGSRFVFGENDTLFFAIGDRGMQDRAQETGRPNGKIHRIHTDGSIPEDNPFAPGSEGAAQHPDALPTVWSWGHRNPQGLAAHPQTDRLYDVEHGPRGGDEINLVEKSHNYGWPVVAYSMNYNQTPFGTNPPFHRDMDFVEPVHYWIPSIAICGANFYVGQGFSKWQNDLFVAALAKQEIHRVRLGGDDGQTVLETEILFENQGRVRDVVPGPDGALWIATEQPGMIRRLVPAD